MSDEVRANYTNFHRKHRSVHVYPTEWVIRTLLGRYPRLALQPSTYPGQRILDLGFGDCRNMPLLHNCGFDIHGVEVDEDVIALGNDTLARLGIRATLRVGTNRAIPYDDTFFDYVLACHSCYYVAPDTTFDDNLDEIARVLKPGAWLVASLPAPDNFILKNARPLGSGHVEITADPFGLRNGSVFRTFVDEAEVARTLGRRFNDVVTCQLLDDFWGLHVNAFLVAGRRRP